MSFWRKFFGVVAPIVGSFFGPLGTILGSAIGGAITGHGMKGAIRGAGIGALFAGAGALAGVGSGAAGAAQGAGAGAAEGAAAGAAGGAAEGVGSSLLDEAVEQGILGSTGPSLTGGINSTVPAGTGFSAGAPQFGGFGEATPTFGGTSTSAATGASIAQQGDVVTPADTRALGAGPAQQGAPVETLTPNTVFGSDLGTLSNPNPNFPVGGPVASTPGGTLMQSGGAFDVGGFDYLDPGAASDNSFFQGNLTPYRAGSPMEDMYHRFLNSDAMDTMRTAGRFYSKYGRPLMRTYAGLQGLRSAAEARRLMRLPDPRNMQGVPGYVAGEEAVRRAMASQGFQGSGNMAAALQKYGGDAYNQYVGQRQQAAQGMGASAIGSLSSLALLSEGASGLAGAF